MENDKALEGSQHLSCASQFPVVSWIKCGTQDKKKDYVFGW